MTRPGHENAPARSSNSGEGNEKLAAISTSDRTAFIDAVLADLEQPLAPAPQLETIHQAWSCGWDLGFLSGLRVALDEAQAHRLLAMAVGGRR